MERTIEAIQIGVVMDIGMIVVAVLIVLAVLWLLGYLRGRGRPTRRL